MTYDQQDLLADLKAGQGQPMKELLLRVGFPDYPDLCATTARRGMVSCKLGKSWVSTEKALDAFLLQTMTGPKEA